MSRSFLIIMAIFMSHFIYGCKYVDKNRYGDITIFTESNRQDHPWGKPIPIKVTVKNDGEKPFTFNTKGRPIRTMGAHPVGLSEPRPVYDLIFNGRGNYYWVWFQHAKEPVSTEIVLQPNETRVLIETVWEPPTKDYMQGGFAVRFADVEFPTGIGIEFPKR